MLRRTYYQCLKAFPSERIFVATDDKRIVSHCEEVGIQVMMTPRECLTGTDRVAAVAEQVQADVYINVQGDEPVINPDDIKAIHDAAEAHPGEIVNGMCPIGPAEEELWRSPSIPKVVARLDNRLLYMSRAPIPTTKGHAFSSSWRQVCIYAFPRNALEAFAAAKEKTPLEAIEDIEILRFLEMGFDVRMVTTSNQSIAVDTPYDIERAEAAIIALGLGGAAEFSGVHACVTGDEGSK